MLATLHYSVLTELKVLSNCFLYRGLISMYIGLPEFPTGSSTRCTCIRASKLPVSGVPCRRRAQSIATSSTSLQLFLCEFVLVRCASSLVQPSLQYYRARRARVVTPLPSNFEVKNVGCEGLLPCTQTS